MTDIVKRLREPSSGSPSWLSTMEEAANEIEELRKALQWMVDNDETNVGDEPLREYGGYSWNVLNAYYIEGLNRAKALLAKVPVSDKQDVKL